MIGSRILHGICHSRLQLAMRWSNQKSYHLHSFGILPYQRCQQEKKNRCVDASENFQQTQGPSCPCLLFLLSFFLMAKILHGSHTSLFLLSLKYFRFALFCWLSFVISLSGARTACSWRPSSCPLGSSGLKDSSFEIHFVVILAQNCHRTHRRCCLQSEPFPLLNKHLETCPGREAWVGGYFGYNFKEHFEPGSSDMKVQGESCSTPPGPVIHWLSNAKSNCKFPHLPSGG